MMRAKKILIADDERGIRKSLERGIRCRFMKEGIPFEIRHAENGEECVRLAKEERPDIILLDIRMPVMDGLQACAVLRNNPIFDPTVIIILTAEITAEVKGLTNGADDYITKPFNMAALLLRIEHGLESAAQRSETLKDPETGLWGRGYFENAQVISELCRAKRYNRSLALLLTEFELPNDVLIEKGSPLPVLSKLSSFLEGRTSDISARWGVRTFAMLLPETAEEGALIFADRLLQRMNDYDQRLSPAMGISVLDPDHGVDTILAFAETSLAVSKDMREISVNGRAISLINEA